ncbi:MAG: ROK family protein [Clostridia bacterium]|nr:ROK family protein [Clostridia bacterium]
MGITQGELADRLHVVRQTISKWEKGLSVPDAALLPELAEALHTTAAVLLGDKAVADNSPAILPGSLSGWESPAGREDNGSLLGAVDIGGTKIQVGLLTETGRVLKEESFPTDVTGRSGEDTVDIIAKKLDELCQKAGVDLKSLLGVGVFCAGPLDTERGTVENPYTLPGWEGLPLAGLLAEKTGLPVKLDNDANGALLGEVFSRGLGNKRVLMLTFGTGIGVAYWNGDDIYRSGRYHPEMGHVIAASRGSRCYCGKVGCFESLCSGSACNDRARAAGYPGFGELLTAARASEPAAKEVLAEILRDFQNGIWTLRVIFKPEVLILAGGFGKAYFPLLQDALSGEDENQEDFTGLSRILPESDVPNAALLGVCMLPWKKKKRKGTTL